MSLSALIPQVGSDFATPTQYTAASPSFNRYRMTSTIIEYGDLSPTVTQPTGIVANGFISVQYHENNQWKTGKIYTSLTGAQINTLVVA